MRQSPICLAVAFLLAIAGLPLTGCTVIGYIAGSAVDNGNATVQETRLPNLAGAATGIRCRITRNDSSAIQGEYLSLQMVSGTQGRKRYEQWRGADSSRLGMPSIGDSIDVIPASTSFQTVHGRLVAVSADTLWVHCRTSSSLYLQGMPLHAIRMVSIAGRGTITGQEIHENVGRRPFPSPLSAFMKVDAREYAIPVDSIAYVDVMERTTPSDARLKFTLIGLGADAVAAAFIAGVVVQNDVENMWR